MQWFLFTACFFNLTSDSGRFNFPLRPYIWRKCRYKIEVPRGIIIRIDFLGSSFPKSPSYCSLFDYIAIYEGRIQSSNLMKRICINGTTSYQSFGSSIHLEVSSRSSQIFANYSIMNISMYSITVVFSIHCYKCLSSCRKSINMSRAFEHPLNVIAVSKNLVVILIMVHLKVVAIVCIPYRVLLPLQEGQWKISYLRDFPDIWSRLIFIRILWLMQ